MLILIMNTSPINDFAPFVSLGSYMMATEWRIYVLVSWHLTLTSPYQYSSFYYVLNFGRFYTFYLIGHPNDTLKLFRRCICIMHVIFANIVLYYCSLNNVIEKSFIWYFYFFYNKVFVFFSAILWFINWLGIITVLTIWQTTMKWENAHLVICLTFVSYFKYLIETLGWIYTQECKCLLRKKVWNLQNVCQNWQKS